MNRFPFSAVLLALTTAWTGSFIHGCHTPHQQFIREAAPFKKPIRLAFLDFRDAPGKPARAG